MIDIETLPVYIIDDDPGITDLAQKTLNIKGFNRVEVANSGKEALDILRIPTEDRGSRTVLDSGLRVVVLDIILPDLNGFDLCKKIKEIYPNILVLLISGFDIDDLHDRIMECDADDFLNKPFNPIELVARLELLVKKHKKSTEQVTTAVAEAVVSNNQVPHIGDHIEDYHIIDTLGWGKSSIIYKVIDENTKQTCALKLLTRNALEVEDMVKRFELEVDMMARLDHPNVVSLYKMGYFWDCPYILMEYIYGINMEEYMVSRGRPPLDFFFKVIIQTASALADIHKVGIIHRDIKLKNIMLEAGSNIVKLTDFGIAHSLNDHTTLTGDGFIVGTPIYMAPEMFRGELASEKSDIYSFGVTFYQFATSSPPFVASSNIELYKLHKEAEPESITKINPEIPSEIDELIVKKCMAKNPEKRPESMTEVLDELQKIERKYLNN